MENFTLENGTLTVRPGTEIILAETFAEREDIERLILPPSLREIGGAAFAGCENLRSVAFEGASGLEQICDGAFTLCHALSAFDFVPGLRGIGEMAFWETALTSVTVPSSVAFIGDSAFWACSELTEFNVLGADCRLDTDVLGDCPRLQRGYIAPGYHASSYYHQSDELVYTLLWLSCPERHTPAVSERARRFIREQELIIMERILERGNTPAMTGLVSQGLLSDANIDRYIDRASRAGRLEITNLLLETKRSRSKKTGFEEFEL